MTLNTLRIGELTSFGTYQGRGAFVPGELTARTGRIVRGSNPDGSWTCDELHSQGYEPNDMNCSEIIAPAPAASVIEPVQQQGQIKPSDWILLTAAVILAVLLLRK